MSLRSTLLLLLAHLIGLLLPAEGQEIAPPEKDAFGKPVAFWLDRLKSTNVLERDEAIQVFSRIGPAGLEAVPLLRELLKEASLATRLQVALALWSLQNTGKDSVAVLGGDYEKMTAPQKARVVEFVLGIKKVDAALFEMLDVLAKDPQQSVRIRFHLPNLGPDAVPFYAQRIESRQGKERAQAIYETPIPFLIASKGEIVARYLKDADLSCQAATATVLLALPEQHKVVLPLLIDIAGSKDRDAADRALYPLAQYRPVVAAASPLFFQGLKHDRFDYRLACAGPLLILHPEKSEAVLPVLEEGLKQEMPNARYPVYPLIQQLGARSEKLIPALLEKVRTPAFGESSMALAALAPHAERVGKEIGEIVFANPQMGVNFLNPTVQPFTPHFLDTVRKHLEGDDAPRRQLALRVVRFMPSSSAVKLLPILTPLLKKDEVAGMTLEAIGALGKEAAPAAAEVVALLDGPNAGRLLGPVRATLGQIEPAATAITPYLEKLRGKAERTADDRILAAELALLNDSTRKQAVADLEPLVSGKIPVGLTAYVRLLEKLGADAAPLVPHLHERIKKDPAEIARLDRVLIRLGAAARVMMPEVVAFLKNEKGFPPLLRTARVVYLLAPEERGPIDERIARLFLEGLGKTPPSSEAMYHFNNLVELCRTGAGPTKALAPVLLKIFRDHARDELRADLATTLVRIAPETEAEVVRTLEANLGTFPANSRAALLGLLRLNPEHPQALELVKKYLQSSLRYQSLQGATVAMECERPLPGVRELLEAGLKNSSDLSFRLPAHIALMRYDGKLNPAWVDEIFNQKGYLGTNVLWLRHLGSVGKPLVPRLRMIAGDDVYKAMAQEVADWLDLETPSREGAKP